MEPLTVTAAVDYWCRISSIYDSPHSWSLFLIILWWFCFSTLSLPQLTRPSPQQTTADPNTVQTLRAPPISTCLQQNNVNSEATAEHPLWEPDYPKTPPLPSLNHVEIWNKSQVTRCAPRGWLQSAAVAPFWGPDLMRQNKQVRAALFVACIRPLKKHSGLWCLDDATESGDVTSIRWRGSSGRSVLCGST